MLRTCPFWIELQICFASQRTSHVPYVPDANLPEWISKQVNESQVNVWRLNIEDVMWVIDAGAARGDNHMYTRQPVHCGRARCAEWTKAKQETRAIRTNGIWMIHCSYAAMWLWPRTGRADRCQLCAWSLYRDSVETSVRTNSNKEIGRSFSVRKYKNKRSSILSLLRTNNLIEATISGLISSYLSVCVCVARALQFTFDAT